MQNAGNFFRCDLRIARVQHECDGDAALIGSLRMRSTYKTLHGVVEKTDIRRISAHPAETTDEIIGCFKMLRERMGFEFLVLLTHYCSRHRLQEAYPASRSVCRSNQGSAKTGFAFDGRFGPARERFGQSRPPPRPLPDF